MRPGTRLVIEADGGSRGNPGPAAYGSLVREAASGEVLAERAAHIGRATNNVAEYRGLLAGLELVRELDPAGDTVVEVRMDSKLVVEQMAGRWKVKHEDMRVLALRCRALLPPTPVTWTWVPRAQNAAADRLANEALDAAEKGQEWVPRGPSAPLSAEPPDPSLTGPVAPPEPVAATVRARQSAGWSGELGPPTTMLLLRHGRTPLTADKRFSGSGGGDPSLDDEGRRQATAAAAALAVRGGVDAVVTSPLRRTRETAAVVAEGLGLPVSVEDGFRECAFGAWDGHTFAEVRARWPEELAGWLASTAVAPPGGESFDEAAARVQAARAGILARRAGETVLVVTHVTPVKLLVREALGAPMSALYRMELSPASLTTVAWWADGGASLRSFNDVGHLQALG